MSKKKIKNQKSKKQFYQRKNNFNNNIIKKHKIKINNISNINQNHINKIDNKIDSNLEDSKFRLINERLYKSDSKDAFEYFKENKEDFLIYHKGFSLQAKKWPKNPNDIILKTLLLPKYKDKKIVDIGCGEGKIGKILKPLGYDIHSYDLVSLNEYVEVADMKNIPLNDNYCDIAIFCLSLMNKNFIPFIIESNRILKIGGKLMVAEISSRIVDLNKLISIFVKYGYILIKQKNIENYFEIMTFKKEKYISITNQDKNLDNTYDILKPCLYKKR